MTRYATHVTAALILCTGALATWWFVTSQPATPHGQPPQPLALSSQVANEEAEKDPGGGETAESDPAGDETEPLLNCVPVTEVASISELAALGPPPGALDSELSSPIITADATATVALTVVLKDLVAENGTQLGGTRIRGTVPGLHQIRLAETRQLAVVIEPGATFRMRFEMRQSLPSTPSLIATFEAPCSALCEAGERRCGLYGGCYSDAKTFCRECQRGSPRRCECVELDGSDKPDGTSCTVVVGDIASQAQCRAGQCELLPR